MLTCLFNRRRLGAYRDGGLADRAARTVAGHLAACAACRSEAQGLDRLHELVRSSVAVGQPDWTGFWPGIARGIEAGARVPAPVRSLAGIERRRLAVASAFAAALLAVTIWQAGDSPRMLSEGSTALAIAETEVPDGSVMVYSPPGDDMTVIWVFGAENHAAGAI